MQVSTAAGPDVSDLYFQYPLAGRLECKPPQLGGDRHVNILSVPSRGSPRMQGRVCLWLDPCRALSVPSRGSPRMQDPSDQRRSEGKFDLSVPSRGSPRMQARPSSSKARPTTCFQYPLAGRLECKSTPASPPKTRSRTFSTL